MMIQLENKIREIRGMFDQWEFFAKPYTEPEVLEKMGTTKDEDDDDVQITNHMMESVVELLNVIKKNEGWQSKRIEDLQWDVKNLRRDLEKAQNYAAMSDPRIAGELDKEIQWYEKNSGQENIVYGPVELMSYCRDRLRSRR